MSANPIDSVAGLTSTDDVSKGDLTAWVKARVAQMMADATELRNTSLVSQQVVLLKSTGIIYYLDVADTTSADDGVTVIISADGKRFKPPTAGYTLDTDGTLAANSDARVASQKAVKTYADQIIAAADAMVFKGVVDCSANPNYPAANRGWTYRVSVAGKIGGASGTNVEVSDTLICLTDSTASGDQATVGAAWEIVQGNLDGAVIGPASATNGGFARFSGTTGKLLQDHAATIALGSEVSGTLPVASGGTGGTTEALARTALGVAYSTQSQAETGTNNASAMTPLTTAEAIVSLGQNFKNVVGRNGGLEVWQRLVNGATTITVAASTTAYTVDGFYLKTAANQASTITQVAGLTNGSNFAARVQRNSGQTGTGAMYFAIPLDADEIAKLRGNKAALSFWVSTGADWSPTSGTLTANLYVGTGALAKRNSSAYTSETNPITLAVNLATSAAAAVKISTASVAIGSTVTQGELQFTWTPTGTAGANDWFAVDDVQIEVVTDGVAPVTPLFERSDFVFDLQRCLRRLWVFGPGVTKTLGCGVCYSTTLALVTFNFPVTMAAAPALSVSAVSDFAVLNAAAGALAGTAFAQNTSSPISSEINITVASGLVAGNAAVMRTNAAGAWLAATAEI